MGTIKRKYNMKSNARKQKAGETFYPYLPKLRSFAEGAMAMWFDNHEHLDWDWWYSITVKDRSFDLNLYCDPDERIARISAYFVGDNGQTITDNYVQLAKRHV